MQRLAWRLFLFKQRLNQLSLWLIPLCGRFYQQFFQLWQNASTTFFRNSHSFVSPKVSHTSLSRGTMNASSVKYHLYLHCKCSQKWYLCHVSVTSLVSSHLFPVICVLAIRCLHWIPFPCNPFTCLLSLSYPVLPQSPDSPSINQLFRILYTYPKVSLLPHYGLLHSVGEPEPVFAYRFWIICLELLSSTLPNGLLFWA